MNCVLNPELDNICGRSHTRRKITSFNKMVNDLNCFDAWRIHNNNDQKAYTWKRRSRPIMRRLDYIFGKSECNQQCNTL